MPALNVTRKINVIAPLIIQMNGVRGHASMYAVPALVASMTIQSRHVAMQSTDKEDFTHTENEKKFFHEKVYVERVWEQHVPLLRVKI